MSGTKSPLILPSFLGLGPKRTASTWLFECLREHPGIFLPETKETYFFNDHYEKGLDYYSGFFRDASNHEAVGDITPDYFACPLCPERIAQHLPAVRMIVVLRNPIDRAFSHYRALVRPRTPWSFEEAIDKCPEILEEGLYSNHLERYFGCFDKAQFLILSFDDLVRDNRRALEQVYTFLNVDPYYHPSREKEAVNALPLPSVARWFTRLGLKPIYRMLARSGAAHLLRRRLLTSKPSASPDIEPQVRARLADYYEVHNRRLATLLGRQLPQW